MGYSRPITLFFGARPSSPDRYVVTGSMQETSSPEQSPQRRTRVRTEAAPVIQRLVESLHIHPKQDILVFGCGRGVDVSWLQRRRFKAQGYDPHVPFGFAQPPDRQFDLVMMIYLMTRLKTDAARRDAIARAFSHVRPGGHLLIGSRHWMHHVHEKPASRDAALDYFNGLLADCDTSEIERVEVESEDNAIAVLAGRAGIYTPRYPIAWVDGPDEMARVCARLADEPMIALDVETTLEEPRKLCTVQLGIQNQSWIIDALAMNDLTPLKALMENDAVEKVIHNAFFEEQMLGKHGIRIHNVFDTLHHSRSRHKKTVGLSHKLGDVCERELGIFLDKTNQTSDWTLRPLAEDQLRYAAIDVEVLVDLYPIFKPPRAPENLQLFE